MFPRLVAQRVMIAAAGFAVHRKFTRSEAYKQTRLGILNSSVESARLITPNKFAAGTWGGDLVCFEAGTESEAKQEGPVKSIARLEDKLFATSDEHLIRIWDVGTLQQVRVLNRNKPQDIMKMAGFPNGLIAAVRGWCGEDLEIWDAHTGELKHQLSGDGNKIKSLVALPQNRLAVGTLDSQVNIWNVDTGIWEQSFKARSVGAAHSFDADTLVTADYKGLLFWNNGRVVKELDLPDLPSFPVHAVTAEGKVIVTSETGAFRIVDVETGQTTNVGSVQDAKHDWHLVPEKLLCANDGTVVTLSATWIKTYSKKKSVVE